MLTMENLKAYGADVAEGLGRCLNNEEFYISLIMSIIPDTRIEELEAAIAAEDLDKAFEIAHALKGMYANLALTPLTIPVTEATELLRSRTHTDYSGCIAELKKQKAALNALME